MGKQSDIQWTDATWNPFHGCRKVSDGCKYCYMYRDKEMYGQDPTIVSRSKTKFKDPLKWKDPKLIFTCSWSDWFIEEADEWRDEAWAIIKACPQHTFQILTKRPERIKDHLPADWGDGYDNVWLGISAENQQTYDSRIHYLLNTQASIRFLSCEPLLGEMDLRLNECLNPSIGGVQWEASELLHWVIVGGESGNDKGKYLYRPCEGPWIHSIIVQCQNAGIPVFVKQFGTYLSKKQGYKDRHGGNIDEWPKHLQVREFPKTFNV